MMFKCLRNHGELVKGKTYEGFKVGKYSAAIMIPDGTAKRVLYTDMQRNAKVKYLVEIKK